MEIFPQYSEVLVSALDPENVIDRLARVTRNVDYLDYDRVGMTGHKFNGVIHDKTFKISLVIDKADSFLPLITGKIETTPLGCILFLNYRLFPGSGFFLAFWSLVTLVLAVFFLTARDEPVYGLISLLIGIVNYLFARNHFVRKIKKSQAIFHKLLNPSDRD